MSLSILEKPVIEISLPHLRRRFLEVLPATLSWGTIFGLTILAFIIPFWIAIFVIIYDLYALIRAVYMSVHLVVAYRRLRREAAIDWLERCRRVNGDVRAYWQEVVDERRRATTRKQRRILGDHARELAAIIASGHTIRDAAVVHHIVVLPTYNESLAVLRTSLASIARAQFPHERLHVVVGFEERAGIAAHERAEILTAEFASYFSTWLTAWHPDGLPGEAQVKSANATWAVRAIEAQLTEADIVVDDILVSNFDSDTVVAPNYFANLTYQFITLPDRYQVSYQPLPVYNNNVWDAPAFSRVIASGSTFWQMIESTRPERLVTFSSHSMTLKALRAIGYWQKDIVSEDSRVFWQCLLYYDGAYRTHPMYTTVSMDAALADTWWRTLINQYQQKRRWAWGIENFPYLAEGFRKNPRISLRVKALYLFRTLEGHYTWATAPIIIAGLGWLPIFFGGPEFHATVLSYSLPFMARTIMSIAMLGLIVSSALQLLLLPPRPGHRHWTVYFAMVFQWALVPFIATILSAFPALDAETRLFLGRDLGFKVMEKARKHSS